MDYKAKQQVVESLEGQLQKPTESQLHFMHEKAVKHTIYYSSAKRLWCTNCYHRFSIGQAIEFPESKVAKGKMVCPHCGASLKVVKSGKSKCEEEGYGMICDRLGDWQILRYFYLENHGYIDGYTFPSTASITYAPSKDCTEVLRIWINPISREKIVQSLPLCPFVYYRKQPYKFTKCVYTDNCHWTYEPTELKVCTKSTENGEFRQEWMLKVVCPRPDIHPYYRKRGINARNINDLWTDAYMKKVDRIPYAETLLKMGQMRLANVFVTQNEAKDYQKQVQIALRHGFNFNKLDRIRDYWDYIGQLRELGWDDLNPKFLAPADFDKAHTRVSDILYKKHEKEREMARREAELKRIKEQLAKMDSEENKFNQRIQRYIGLAIVTSGGISITPLSSVQAFYEEGEAMHHCVYSCGYYAKEDSLVLSARDAEGNRLETIEVNLKTMKVEQSRGFGNKPTSMHKDILKAIEDNMWQIRQMRSGKAIAMAS